MERFDGDLEGIPAFNKEVVALRVSFSASVDPTFWDTGEGDQGGPHVLLWLWQCER